MPEILVLFAFWHVNMKYSSLLRLLFLGAPSTVGLFSSVTLKYGLVAWQADRGTLLSSWTVCLFATVAIFAALIRQLGARSQIFFIHSLKNKKQKKKNQNPDCSPDCFNRYIGLEFDFVAMPMVKSESCFSAWRQITHHNDSAKSGLAVLNVWNRRCWGHECSS